MFRITKGYFVCKVFVNFCKFFEISKFTNPEKLINFSLTAQRGVLFREPCVASTPQSLCVACCLTPPPLASGPHRREVVFL